MGVGNAGSQTILRATLGDQAESPSELSAAFAVRGFTESTGQMVGFFVGPLLPLQTKARIMFTLWMLAVSAAVCALGSDYQRRPLKAHSSTSAT